MINATAEYALRAVVFLASNESEYVSRGRLARETKIPSDYLVRVLMSLDEAAVLTSQRGRRGGYRLNCKANELTVYDVIAAVTALPTIVKCPLGIEEHIDLCPLHARLNEVAEMAVAAYRATSVAELLPKECKAASGCAFPQS
ncbi:MAG: Rrf2 family transcriptional regulator [Planctomycetales bacterium]|nr:Rrf2 family transcriptional regulator [Planctomycetales bacterium]MCA9183363.1 Rrf2 family transcriptional regulator [Planctomycetales bacterium]